MPGYYLFCVLLSRSHSKIYVDEILIAILLILNLDIILLRAPASVLHMNDTRQNIHSAFIWNGAEAWTKKIKISAFFSFLRLGRKVRDI